MLPQLDTLRTQIANPEYLYLILEPMALYGLFFGLLFFIATLALKQDKARMVSLFFIAISSLSVFPYRVEKADAMQRTLVVRDTGYTRMMKKHALVRDQSLWVHYTLAGAAFLTLISRGKLATITNLIMIIGGLAALIFFLWLNLKESEIYHPNLRRATAQISQTSPYS
ncbi:hypothetical protein FEM03_13130 [Phragmitibacter flavus]|uniref:Uncharacterized protein n=1 Tax=Phragmitibacter flavus TaxID=2576071 RepID=A0A5R8KDW1_9BACT|nr:hypothetical protein [Phragmitibacter flavus]TLD70135.1 hypothetical protein FEM03_13130 [Phragmitibacter flavus]